MSVLLFCRDDKTNDQIIMNPVPSDSKFQDLYSGTNFFRQKEIDGAKNTTQRVAATSHRWLMAN